MTVEEKVLADIEESTVDDAWALVGAGTHKVQALTFAMEANAELAADIHSVVFPPEVLQAWKTRCLERFEKGC